MKISLDSNCMFWGLMNPKDLTLTTRLDESNPSLEVDEKKLAQWEISQIIGSVKEKRISISVQVEDLVKSLSNNNTETKDKKVSKKTKAAELQA